jgi:hypothetical protein
LRKIIFVEKLVKFPITLKMSDSEIERLKHRRQYFLSPSGMKCPFVHNERVLNVKYVLYTHIDLLVTEYEKDNIIIVLLGDIYDYINVDYKNADILRDLFDNDFDRLLEKSGKYAGRYVILYCKGDEIKLVHDASACRKIFYTKKNDMMICASNEHLLAEIAGCQKTTNQSLLDYYRSTEYYSNLNSNIGYLTYYDDIRQVLPNHYLNIEQNEVQRYWPNRVPESYNEEESVTLSINMIKGFITAAANRYKLMIPVTSGYDSRVILAATKDITDKIFFYLNFSDETQKSLDFRIPQKMLSKLNINFNLLTIDDQVDEKFRAVYFQNNPLADEEFLPIIYNYYKNHSGKLNLPGNIIPIVKALNHSSAKFISSELLARLQKKDKIEAAHTFYENWFNLVKETANQFGINIFDLLYWEDESCNRALQVQLYKDIAQEEFIPFNSRQLILTMLAYDVKLRQKPYYRLHKAIIQKLWSELLDFPFNPSFKHSVKQVLIVLKIYQPFMFFKKVLSGK